METLTLKAALWYARKGLHVFPVTKDKVPFKGTHGYKDASVDPEVIKAMWAAAKAKDEHVNVAIATGKISNLIVVDVDPRNGGTESWKEIVGDNYFFTHTVTSGSGGRHFYFKYDATRKFPNQIAEGVDVLSDKKQVVAPPSENCVGRYDFKYRNNPNLFPRFQFADLPPWLDAYLVKPKAKVDLPNIDVNMEVLTGAIDFTSIKGAEHWARCPFHQENSPSFSVNADTGCYNCFGCGKSGSFASLVFELRIGETL